MMGEQILAIYPGTDSGSDYAGTPSLITLEWLSACPS